MIMAALLSACGGGQDKSTPDDIKKDETFDPASYAVDSPSVLVGKCAHMGNIDPTKAIPPQDSRMSCTYIAEKHILGPDCLKMAETGLQNRMDAVASGRCQFQHGRNEGADDDRGVELRANSEEIRACLDTPRSCKRLDEEAVLTSEACSSYAFWAVDNDPLTKEERFSRDEARTICELSLDHATRKAR